MTRKKRLTLRTASLAATPACRNRAAKSSVFRPKASRRTSISLYGSFAGVRDLRLQPILVLALGICASVAIFAFVDAALIKPLPYQNPSRLVVLFETISVGPRFHLSYLDYLDWKKLNTLFQLA